MPRTVVALTVVARVIIAVPTLPAMRMRAPPMTTVMSTIPAPPRIMAMLTAIRIPIPVPMSMRRHISAGPSRSASA